MPYQWHLSSAKARITIPLTNLIDTEKIARIRCAAIDSGDSFPWFIPLGYLWSPFLFSSLCTPPLPLSQIIHRCAEPLPPCQCYLWRIDIVDAHDITALRNDIAVARGQQTKPRTHGAFFADGLQVISVVQNTEKRCELMLLQAESSGLHDVVPKCMPSHGFRLFLRTKRVSICSCHLCSDAPYYHDTVDGPSCHPPEFPWRLSAQVQHRTAWPCNNSAYRPFAYTNRQTVQYQQVHAHPQEKTERHFDLQTTKVNYYYCRYSATSAFINIDQNNICC